jgi:hypothetical protein
VKRLLINKPIILLAIMLVFSQQNIFYNCVAKCHPRYFRVHSANLFPNVVLVGVGISDQTIQEEWAEHIANMGNIRNAYIILVIKCERKKPLWGPKHR